MKLPALMEQTSKRRKVRKKGSFCLSFALLFFCSVPLALGADTYREAYDSGYKDGFRSGKQDREQKRRFDLANRKAFQSANRGFDETRHEEDVYALGYRRGFEDGYEQGYGLMRGETGYPVSHPLEADSSPQRRDPIPPPERKEGTDSMPAGTRVRVQLLDSISTRRSERGDEFRVEVIEAVKIGGKSLIPKGTRILGTIGRVQRAGRVSGRAKMNLQFDEIHFADGSRHPFPATVVSIRRGSAKVKDREGTLQGSGSRGRDARTVGTVSGIGGLVGVLTRGRKGAAVGAATGAIIGLARVMTRRGRDIQLHPYTELTIRLNRKVFVPSR